LERGTERRCTL